MAELEGEEVKVPAAQNRQFQYEVVNASHGCSNCFWIANVTARGFGFGRTALRMAKLFVPPQQAFFASTELLEVFIGTSLSFDSSGKAVPKVVILRLDV